jgi:nitroimidazol reductase NimA-like FMN-containing flavoprotein (pyridoxamine 5'-phosphate oxidase superfamily)
MPGYGIAEAGDGKGLLPWSWALERLNDAHNYFVATTRPDGRPHVMPVWGVWLDDALYFSTGAGSRKARNLAANASCTVTTERADEAVIVEGVAEEATDAHALKRFVEVYKEKYDWEIDTSGGGIYAVRPRAVFGFIEAADNFSKTATRWTFD